jgi:aminopeptidase
MIDKFDHLLKTFAEVTVKVGLNLRSGQNLVIGGAYTRGVPLEVAPLVREIAASAYRAGARYVDVIWEDPSLRLMRFQMAPRDSFDYLPAWRTEARLHYLKQADTFLTISADDPDLLRDQDPALIGQELHQVAKANKPVRNLVSRNALNRCVVAASTPGWAARVIPGRSPEEQVDELWQAIFSICRIDQPDPLAAWQAHDQQLTARAQYLTDKAYDAFHYTGPETDLVLGMPAGAWWKGGGATSESGIYFIANLPTEEVFCMPHRERVDGTIRSSRPLSHGSTLIDDFHLTFEKGRVVKAQAGKGEDVLRQLLATDENAGRLGEISFVPHSSAISSTGILFYNTLIDENAASHLAFGNAYRFSLKDGQTMNDDEFTAAGGNLSGVHVDFMVGSDKLDVDGITRDGAVEPVMRQGEWAFDI